MKSMKIKMNNLVKKFTVAVLTVASVLTLLAPATAFAKDPRDYERHTGEVDWDEPGVFQCKLGTGDITVGRFYAMHEEVDSFLDLGLLASYDLVRVVDQDGKNFLIQNWSKGGTYWIKLEKTNFGDYIPGCSGDIEVRWLYSIDYLYIRSPHM